MANDWQMRKQEGGATGDALDKCGIRVNADGTAYELVGVLAVKSDNGQLPEPPFDFPEFAYQGLVWNIHVETFKYEGRDEGFGGWTNNSPPGPPGEEDGTWTAQAGSGGVEEGCEEDASSASA